jgi:predicted secreted hydrolase
MAAIAFVELVPGEWLQTFYGANALQGESKKTDTFDIQMNNKGVSFFWLTLYRVYKKKGDI